MNDVPPLLRRRATQAITVMLALWLLPYAADLAWPGTAKYGPPMVAVILLGHAAFDIALVWRPERLGMRLVGGNLPNQMVERKKWNLFFGLMSLAFGGLFLFWWLVALI